jgi:hypothetical protein
MYEYDVYADARQTLPRVREPLQAMDGEYYLVKTDILARTMSFSSSKDTISNMVTIPTSRVREIIAANRAGRKVESIANKDDMTTVEEPTFRTEEDSITRFDNQNKRRRNRNRRDRDRDARKRQAGQQSGDNAASESKSDSPKENPNREPRENREGRENRGRDRRRNNRSRQRGEGQRREGGREPRQHKEQE